MITLDPGNIIFSLLSAVLGKPITASDYEVSAPISKLGAYNTEVTLTAKFNGNFYVKHKLNYNRIDLTNYSPLFINRTGAESTVELLSLITRSAEFEKHITIDTSEEPVNFLTPPLTASDLTQIVLPTSTEQSFFITSAQNSYLFTGAAEVKKLQAPVLVGIEINDQIPLSPIFSEFIVDAYAIIPPVFSDFIVETGNILPAVFTGFEVTVQDVSIPNIISFTSDVYSNLAIPNIVSVQGSVTTVTARLTSFSITPIKTRINEQLTIGFSAVNLQINKNYIGYIFYETGAISYDGSLFYKTSLLTTDSAGSLSFTGNTLVPIDITTNSLFLLITEETQVIPNTVTATGVYSEKIRSPKLLITSSDENVSFTTVLFGTIISDQLNVNQVSVEKLFLSNINNEVFMISLSSIISGELKETIVYKSSSFTDDSSILLNTSNVVEGSLNETIVYKTFNQSETQSLNLLTSEVISGSLTTVISYIQYTSVETNQLSLGLSTISSGTLI